MISDHVLVLLKHAHELDGAGPERSLSIFGRDEATIAPMIEYFQLSYFQEYAFCMTFLMPFSLFVCQADQRIRPDYARLAENLINIYCKGAAYAISGGEQL